MATHALGKLKFNLSKQGLAYRWGDGEIHRLFGGKAKADADEAYNDENNYSEYDEENGYADPGYGDDAYADDPGYDDGDGFEDGDDEYYDDPGYDDEDDGYDDGYDDDYAEDDGYDDGYGDDGYDDGYADDDYADDGYADEGEYDDRYQDEDAEDGYGDEYYQSQSPLMQYVDENDWVTYLLLFLFPPLGIYLLWRRNRFDKPIRWAITAASAIWFVVALILLLSGILGGAGDQKKEQEASIVLAPTTTASALKLDGTGGGIASDKSVGTDISDLNTGVSAVEPSLNDADTGDTSVGSGAANTGAEDGAEAAPSPTPLTTSGGADNSVLLNASDYVYSPATGLYYHSKSDCRNIDAGVSVSRVPRDVAVNNRKQSACPVCIGASSGGDTTTYYATRGGSYYHTDRTCSGMTDAVPYTKEAAERAGKTECPVCIKHVQQSLATGAVKFITESTKDKSNINVYSTEKGKYYHMSSNCSGMTGASRGSLKDALLKGKTACPTCCAAAGSTVYCTKDGTYYHQDSKCSGMNGAAEVSLAEAMVLGKRRCHTCIKGNLPTASQLAQQADANDDAMVWATRGGKYYHTDEHCSGMTGAKRYSLKSMLQQNRKACPVCASASDTVVYASEGGTYYHSYATCSGMTNAKSATMAQAMAYGYKRCPRCWSKSSASLAGNYTGATTVSSSATARNTYVYATKAGSYYHLRSTCSGMKNASRVTLKQAIDAGKKACPTCAGSANRTVYSTDSGKHYHAASVCEKSGLKNGTARTLAQALMKGQTACKYCMTGSSAGAKSTTGATTTVALTKDQARLKAAAKKLKNSHTYKDGKSGIKVYARADGKYYHRKSNCGGLKNASHITLEAALNYGKRACPKCAASARRTVYATRGGKYYHYSKTHAGVGAKTGTMGSALAYGYDPCPYCVTKTKTVSHTDTYKSGTSGIKVYATTTSKYFHSKGNCSGMKNPSRITLETALNYGKTACPTCLASGGKKVYSSSSDSYYHLYKAHAGSSAKAGTLAQAKAAGKKACPTCQKGPAIKAAADAATKVGITQSDAAKAAATVKAAAKAKAAARAAAKAAFKKGTTVSYSKAPVSQYNYAASGSSNVYISMSNSKYFYYHKSSRCSGSGMKGGTKVTLQYAKDWGFKACPYCNPPTIVSETA